MNRKHEGPTRMTSVLLGGSERSLTNGEIVDRITLFMDDLDVEVLVAKAVRDAVDQFIATGAWRPGAFTCAITGVSQNDLKARTSNDSDLRKPVRIPADLHDLVKDAASRLGCTQGVIIRSALTGVDLSSPRLKKLPALDPDEPGIVRRRALLSLG